MQPPTSFILAQQRLYIGYFYRKLAANFGLGILQGLLFV